MAKKRDFTRLLVIADLHCGHHVGLMPPDYWSVLPKEDGKKKKIAKSQRELWKWYSKEVDLIKPVDYVVVNGDMIDGKGERSGSTEAKEAARNEQCRMAAYCIDYIGARECGLIHGTAYHDGGQEDWAHVVASFMKTPTMFVSGHKFFNLNGWWFDFKHKISRSTIPHGQATPLKRAKLWNLIWNSRDNQQPKADYLIRSHVHYYCEDYDGATRCRGFITPALQGHGTKYGVRECENTVDIGFIYFDVGKKGVVCHPLISTHLNQQFVSPIHR